ncbi:MAG: serine/threonine-protein phosphatase [Sedimentisphaerales bacterium]|nr:serine/threonine-protein phosphatase [Sedimentisphaerales bacterium]
MTTETDSDLQLAKAVQEALLNCCMPESKFGKIILKNRMSIEVGGDFYHFNQLNQDQIAFAIGDVVGHGTAAALIMSIILGLIRSDQKNQSRPRKIVDKINTLLVNLGRQAHWPVTCSIIFGVVDMPSGNLFYVNAGHPHPIIANRNIISISYLPPTSMILGVQEGVREESCHQFQPGDRLILYTDGLTEAPEPRGKPYGQDRLIQVILDSIEMDPEHLAHILFNEVDTFSQKSSLDDDQTLVIMDFENIATEL